MIITYVLRAIKIFVTFITHNFIPHLNSFQILDATLITGEQRTEVLDYFSNQLGYRVLFIECVCDDPAVVEENCQEIIRFNLDYADMDNAKAMQDLTMKIEHYQKAYQPLNDPSYPKIRINTSTMEIQANKLRGHIEAIILGYLGSVTLKPHTLYFSRVRVFTLECKKYSVCKASLGNSILNTFYIQNVVLGFLELFE